jgi:hypothetical protein
MRRNPSAVSSLPDTVSPSLFPCLSSSGESEITLTIYVQPRASRTRITGLHDGSLKLALTAPPVEGQANRQVISYLAKLFRVPKSAIAITGGEQGRTKRLRVAGVSLSEAAAILGSLLGESGASGQPA